VGDAPDPPVRGWADPAHLMALTRFLIAWGLLLAAAAVVIGFCLSRRD
jgi:hypothetical protein